MKYIMFKFRLNPVTTNYVPVIFPNLISHEEMATKMLNGPLAGYGVHSAGFFQMEPIGVFGEALGIKADPRDAYRVKATQHGNFCLD